jgi:molybdopterin-guanine dinucleotide biosynthesis protein A
MTRCGSSRYVPGMQLVAGIFVGGRASRMGGVAKGWLMSPEGEPIVRRTRRILEAAGASCVLVGAHSGYAELRLDALPDDAAAEGPLAGLLALFTHAADRHALAVACDMPFFSASLVRRLIDAPPAPVVAPRRRDRVRGLDVWEPLFARYDARAVLPSARAFAVGGGRKLQGWLDDVGARPLVLTPEDEEELEDWDAPADLPPGGPHGTWKP